LGTSWNTDGGIHEVPLPAGCSGRLWLCGKHAVAPHPDAVLQRTGAAAVVCLTEDHELTDRYPDYVGWLRAHDGGQAEWFPIHDLGAPELPVALPFLRGLARRLDAGEGLVVHCGAGIGRAGTIAIAVLVLLGESLDEASQHVRSHRPMAGPEAGRQLEFLHLITRASG
jgi:protein-tyrosine phosphatase